MFPPSTLGEHLRARFGAPFGIRFPPSPPMITFDDPAADVVLATALRRHRVRRGPCSSHGPVLRRVTRAPAKGTPIVIERR